MKHSIFVCALILSLFSFGMKGGSQAQQDIVVVPNVEGISWELASQILHNAGLEPQGMSATLSALVARQHPRPGMELPQGSVVVLFPERANQVASQDVYTDTPSSITASSDPRIGVRPTMVPSFSPEDGTITERMAVTVTPQSQTTVGIQAQSHIQTGTMQQGQSTIFYEPIQPRLTPYFVQNQIPRFYPTWYPKKFIPATASQDPMAIMQQRQPTSIGQPQTVYTITVMPTTPAATGQASVLYFPKVGTGQESIWAIQSDTPTRVGLIETSTSPAVSVPNVIRLHQQDAASALTKAGLLTGTVLLVDSIQVRPGYVIDQSPKARQLVPYGTQIQLWVAR